MDIILYNNSAEPNRLDKSLYLSAIMTLSGTLRNQCSLINPSIIIDVKSKCKVMNDSSKLVVDDNQVYSVYDVLSKFIGCNYVYIEDFNRYYYVDNITSISKDLWQIDLSVDTLMSYKDKILEQSGIISRNENVYNKLIKDDKLVIKSNRNISIENIEVTYSIDLTETLDESYDYNCVMCCVSTTGANLHATGTVDSYDTLPSIPSNKTAYADRTNYVLLPSLRMAGVTKDVLANDTLASYIKSIIVLPFALEKHPYGTDTSTVTDIYVGNTEVDSDGNKNLKVHNVNTGNYNRFKYATITMPTITDFTDLEPYTEYELFIPYVGFKSINMSENAGCTITIFYNIDFASGQSHYILFNETKHLVIDNGSAEIGYRVSLNASNALELQNQKTSLAISTTLNLLASSIAIAGGVATGNPLSVAGGVIKGANAIGTATTQSMQMYNKGTTTINANTIGLALYNQVILKKTKYELVSTTGYASLFGKPLMEYKKLSDLTGYTVVDSIHLEGINNATSTEIDNIDSLLKSGIII